MLQRPLHDLHHRGMQPLHHALLCAPVKVQLHEVAVRPGHVVVFGEVEDEAVVEGIQVLLQEGVVLLLGHQQLAIIGVPPVGKRVDVVLPILAGRVLGQKCGGLAGPPAVGPGVELLLPTVAAAAAAAAGNLFGCAPGWLRG